MRPQRKAGENGVQDHHQDDQPPASMRPQRKAGENLCVSLIENVH